MDMSVKHISISSWNSLGSSPALLTIMNSEWAVGQQHLELTLQWKKKLTSLMRP